MRRAEDSIRVTAQLPDAKDGSHIWAKNYDRTLDAASGFAIQDDIGAGDCVALHTGQGNSWSNDRYKSMSSEERKAARDLFAQGEPGFGISACEYMAERDIALTMGDTSANDAQPSGELGTDYAVHCHTEMQPRRGIWNLENVDTKSFVDNGVLEAAFIWAPPRMIGASGSPGNPAVIY